MARKSDGKMKKRKGAKKEEARVSYMCTACGFTTTGIPVKCPNCGAEREDFRKV